MPTPADTLTGNPGSPEHLGSLEAPRFADFGGKNYPKERFFNGPAHPGVIDDYVNSIEYHEGQDSKDKSIIDGLRAEKKRLEKLFEDSNRNNLIGKPERTKLNEDTVFVADYAIGVFDGAGGEGKIDNPKAAIIASDAAASAFEFHYQNPKYRVFDNKQDFEKDLRDGIDSIQKNVASKGDGLTTGAAIVDAVVDGKRMGGAFNVGDGNIIVYQPQSGVFTKLFKEENGEGADAYKLTNCFGKKGFQGAEQAQVKIIDYDDYEEGSVIFAVSDGVLDNPGDSSDGGRNGQTRTEEELRDQFGDQIAAALENKHMGAIDLAHIMSGDYSEPDTMKKDDRGAAAAILGKAVAEDDTEPPTVTPATASVHTGPRPTSPPSARSKRQPLFSKWKDRKKGDNRTESAMLFMNPTVAALGTLAWEKQNSKTFKGITTAVKLGQVGLGAYMTYRLGSPLFDEVGDLFSDSDGVEAPAALGSEVDEFDANTDTLPPTESTLPSDKVAEEPTEPTEETPPTTYVPLEPDAASNAEPTTEPESATPETPTEKEEPEEPDPRNRLGMVTLPDLDTTRLEIENIWQDRFDLSDEQAHKLQRVLGDKYGNWFENSGLFEEGPDNGKDRGDWRFIEGGHTKLDIPAEMADDIKDLTDPDTPDAIDDAYSKIAETTPDDPAVTGPDSLTQGDRADVPETNATKNNSIPLSEGDGFGHAIDHKIDESFADIKSIDDVPVGAGDSIYSVLENRLGNLPGAYERADGSFGIDASELQNGRLVMTAEIQAEVDFLMKQIHDNNELIKDPGKLKELLTEFRTEITRKAR